MADEIEQGYTAEEAAALVPEAAQPAVRPEPAAEPRPEPETPLQAAEGETPPAPREDALVPSSRLREEAERRRAAEQRYQRDFGKMEERFQALQRQLQPAEKPQTPDWDNAPLDAGKRLSADLAEVRQQLQQQAQQRQFRDAYAAQAMGFAREHADFGHAYQHFVASVAAELQDAGWSDPAVVAQEIERLEGSIAAKAMQDGVNPAERIYAVAKRRGYQAAAAGVANGNGAANGAGNPAEHVQTLQQGQRAAASTAGRGAAPPAGGMSLAKLLEMDDDEFSRVSARDWRRANGA